MARKLQVEILGDSSSLERAYRRSSAAGKKWSDDISHVSRGAAVAQVGFRGLGRSIAFASAGFLGGAAISAGIKNVISSASDLNEEANKSNVVFGKSAQQVQAWARTTADASGIARAAALEAAGGFGSILETSGLAEGAAAKMSTRLVNLAGDIASFNNIDPSEALEKLRSGLVGEAEPLRTVGVLLSESRVKQEAYRLGLAKQGAALTEAQKVQARYSLILSDTTRQQGDFARTSDGLANAQRRVKASLTNISASIGSAILPALAGATSGFADFLGKLGEAKSVKAKIDVVVEGAEGLARQGIDFAKRFEEGFDNALRTLNFEAGTRVLFNRIRDALGQIDWGEVGRTIGDRLINALGALRQIIEGIDWGVVGRGIVRGIVNFLKGVDWVRLVKGILRLLFVAFIAQYKLLIAAGKELATQLLDGLKAGLKAAGTFLEKEALKLTLAILKPLDITVLGKHIVPGLHGLVVKIQGELDLLATSAESTAGRVEKAIGRVNRSVALPPEKPKADTTTKPTTTLPPVTTPDTKPTETKLEKAQKAFAKLMDALSLKQERAEATRTLTDDIAAQKRINAAIEAEIKVEGRTTDLARQLFEGRQKLIDLGKQQAQAQQFRALGLTAEGEERVGSAKTLLRRAQRLQDLIKGTPLDTAKTRNELRRIVAVLKAHLKDASRETRQAIKQMLDDIAGAFDQGSDSTKPLTKFAKRGVEGLVKNLGLTPEQVKEIRQRFAQFGRLDVGPAAGAPAGRRQRGGGLTRGFVSPEAMWTLHVYIDGKEVETRVTKRQQKTRGRTRAQRRGVRPGI